MCAGCSEISFIVIVKYVQHVGIIRAFCLPGGNLLRGISTQAETMQSFCKSCIFAKKILCDFSKNHTFVNGNSGIISKFFEN